MAKQVAAKRKGRTARPRRTSPLGIALGLLLALLVLLGGGYLALCAMVNQSVILSNTSINGVDVSILTPEEADAALQEDFAARYQGASVTVTLDGEAYTVSLWDEGGNALALDTSSVIEEAMERGHGSFLTRGLEWFSALSTPWSAQALVSVGDRDVLLAAIAASGIGEANTATETTYEIGAESITLYKGEDGVRADVEALADQITALVDSGATLDGAALESATVASSASALDLQSIYNEIYTAPVDATLDPDNGYAIVPSTDGVSFDVNAARVALEEAGSGETVTVELIRTEADLTTAELESCLFRDVMGSYSTRVSGSSGRRENVRLAAEFCDGVILMPGEVFNYNDVVGERTTERGFSAATAYLNGKEIQEVGGGICQVSSTLYAATLYADLEIVTRVNHTYASSYIGLGLDATVSWGGPEFEFRNNTDYPIRVDASYSGGQLNVSIRGTKTNDITVEMVSETLEVIPAKTGSGHTGYKVQTYRNRYDGDGNLVSSEKEAYSHYQAN